MLLSDNWLVDEPIDFEYKQYVLLAFEQVCKKDFDSNNIFPYYTIVRQNYDYVKSYLTNKKVLEDSHKDIDSLNFETGKIVYKTKIVDDRFNDMFSIAEFGETVLNRLILQANDLYESLKERIKIHQVTAGIDFKKGYLIVEGRQKYIFDYTIDRFFSLNEDEKHKNVSTRLVEDETISSNKNIYVVDSDLPIDTCLLPIVKAKILNEVNQIFSKL